MSVSKSKWWQFSFPNWRLVGIVFGFVATRPLGESMSGRLQPFGFAVLVLVAQSFALPCHAEPPGFESDIRAYNLAHGRVVFTDKCMRCHESGRKDAPVFGDTGDWEERLEQPLDTLIKHAVYGHGRMPARGETEITDQDVAAAVAYVVNRTRIIAADEGKLQPPVTAPADQAGGSLDRAVVQMFLLMLGKDRWN